MIRYYHLYYLYHCDTIIMDSRINKKVSTYVCDFKTQTTTKLNELMEQLNRHASSPAFRAMPSAERDITDKLVSTCNGLLSFVYNYPAIELDKSDFVKRKRVKNVVPICDRCCAKRASGEQCTRRKKDGEQYCGTHVKGAPHGILDETASSSVTKKKVSVWGQDIKGIVYYIDDNGNVYNPEDILSNRENPRVIAKYVKTSDGGYSIPGLFQQIK